VTAAGKAVRNPALTPTRHKGARRSLALIKSAPASEGLLVPSGFRATPLPAGSKKAARLPTLGRTLLPAPASSHRAVLELDELWSFVGRKADKRWIWVALARHTRQVLAYAIGDRGERTCRRLWGRIPESYKGGCCYSDFWEAYRVVIPQECHEAVGKESGELAHVERWNNTLRQRLARFVRKTLSFSKSDEMHEVCVKLFVHRYNADVILH
jgi:insertion element IS1 protein InsB